MERGVERVLLAKIGALLFTGALMAPAWVSAVSSQASSVMVATAVDVAAGARALDARDANLEVPDGLPRGHLALISVASSVEEDPLPSSPEPLVMNGIVVASWYGPGFFGNRTACGQTFSAEIVGVAHRTLPCGTRIQLTSPSGVTVFATVIDRGPFVAGRSLDLSAALKSSLGCSDLCHVRMVVVEK